MSNPQVFEGDERPHLLYLMGLLHVRRPASLELCAIGSRRAEPAVELPIKYRLFEFGKEWVAGYGMGVGGEKASANLWDINPG